MPIRPRSAPPRKPRAPLGNPRALLAMAAAALAAVGLPFVAWPILFPLRPSQTTPEPPSNSASLSAYIRALGYEPLQIPRDDWGPGTIVSFKDGHEHLERFNETCLKLKVPPLVRPLVRQGEVRVAAVSLPSRTAHIARQEDIDIGGGTDALGGQALHLAGAYDDNRVATVLVNIPEAYRVVAAEGDIKDKVESAAETSKGCAASFADKNTLVINDVLVIGASQIQFVGSTGAALTIDARLRHFIGAKDNLTYDQADKTTLTVLDLRIVGYNTMRPTVNNGSVKTTVDLRPVALSEIAQRKAASRSSLAR